MEDVFDSLTESIDKVKIKSWEVQEAQALAERGDALRIYDLQMQKGELNTSAYIEENSYPKCSSHLG